MWLFRPLIITLFGAMSLWASAETFQAEHGKLTLKFPGEIVLDRFSSSHQIFVIVRSCAPYPEGCPSPMLKARAVRWENGVGFKWEFSNLKSCPGGAKAYYSWSENKNYRDDSVRSVMDAITPCLSKSYMASPWQRMATEKKSRLTP